MANILTDKHRLRLDHKNIDKMVVLQMNKSFMERTQRKEAFSSIELKDFLSVNQDVRKNK